MGFQRKRKPTNPSRSLVIEPTEYSLINKEIQIIARFTETIEYKHYDLLRNIPDLKNQQGYYLEYLTELESFLMLSHESMSTTKESPVAIHLTCIFKEGKDKSKFFKAVQDTINNEISEKLDGHITNINYLGYLEHSIDKGTHWHYCITYNKAVLNPYRLQRAIEKASKAYLTSFSLGRNGIKEHHLKTKLVEGMEHLCYITKVYTKDLLPRKQKSTNIKALTKRVKLSSGSED